MDEVTLGTKVDYAVFVDFDNIQHEQGYDTKSDLLRLFVLEGIERHGNDTAMKERGRRRRTLEEANRILKDQDLANKTAGQASNALNVAFQTGDSRLIQELIPPAQLIVEAAVCNPVIREGLERSIRLAEKSLLT